MPLPITLSLSESARLFGVSQRTLRRAIAAEELPFTLVQGRYKLNFTDLLRWSERSSRTRQKRDTEGVGQYVTSWKTPPSTESGTTPALPTQTEQPLAFKRTQPKKEIPPQPQTTTTEEPSLNWD